MFPDPIQLSDLLAAYQELRGDLQGIGLHQIVKDLRDMHRLLEEIRRNGSIEEFVTRYKTRDRGD